MNRLIRTFLKLTVLVSLGLLATFKCDAQIRLTDDITAQLRLDYITYTLEREVEFAFCLYGMEVGDTTYVTTRVIPPQRGTWNTVSWQQCSDTFMGLQYVAFGHSHPPDHRNSHRLSNLDLHTFSLQPVRHTILLFALRGQMYASTLSK